MKQKTEWVQIAVRITPEDRDRVKAVVASNDLSQNETFRRLIHYGLDAWERDHRTGRGK